MADSSMFKDWLFGKIRTRALSASGKEVEQFVDSLKAMGDRDLGVVVAVATVIRINLENEGLLDKGTFGHAPLPSAETLGVYQMKINKLARQFTRMGLATDAVGAMVWSYSLRCLNIPELLPLGREMWSELGRGFPHAEEALRRGETEKGEPFGDRVWAEWGEIPAGFHMP